MSLLRLSGFLAALLLLAGCPFEYVEGGDALVPADDDDAATDDDDASDDDDATPDDDDDATPADDDDATAPDDDDATPPDDADDGPADDDDAAPASGNDDLLEENDAAPLATLIGAGLEAGLVSCDGDEDWFSIALAEGDELSVTVSFTAAEGDIDLEVLDPNGSQLGLSETITDTESVGPLVAAVAGAHLVRVFLYGDAGATPGSAYDLDISVVPAVVPDPDPEPDPEPTPSAWDCSSGDVFESNDDPGSAVLIYDGYYTDLTSCGDDDYYWVSLGSFSTLIVDVWFDHAEGDVDVGIFDSWGSLVDSGISETSNETAEADTGFFGDDFTIDIELYADTGPTNGNGYEMDVWVF